MGALVTGLRLVIGIGKSCYDMKLAASVRNYIEPATYTKVPPVCADLLEQAEIGTFSAWCLRPPVTGRD